MGQDKPGSIISPLLSHCPPSLASSAYLSQTVFDHEQDRIWRRNWIYAGRLNDLPKANIRRMDIAGQNLILVRDREGNVTCFHNTCRHRGSELCSVDEKPLKSKLIVCPYHQWSFAADGRLVQIPHGTPTADFDKSAHGLFKVHVHVWSGFMFVCLADDPPPFSDSPDLGEHALDNWPMADLVTGHVLTKTIACNWKIFWENYNECLHCPGIHPELSDLVPIYGQGYMSAPEAPDYDPAHEGKNPLRTGARTWTLDGQVCGPEFPDLTDSQRETGHLFVTLLPTMFVVAHVDYVRVISMRPVGPEQTEICAEWLFAGQTVSSPDFDLDKVVKFATMVLEQDAAACEMNQRGLRSARFDHGTLMPEEFDVFRFHEWVRARTDYAAATREEK